MDCLSELRRVHTTMQLVVPATRIKKVLLEMHNGSGTHFEINKTLSTVRERFYWVHCREDEESWCKNLCGSQGPRTRANGPMQQYNVGSPFERVAVDIAGPFPVTEDGNKYIMVVSDYFSKWPKAYAIPNQEVTTVAKMLIDNWISRFGVPMELNSDQRRNVESNLFQRVTEVLRIQKTRTTPLHPHAWNGRTIQS